MPLRLPHRWLRRRWPACCCACWLAAGRVHALTSSPSVALRLGRVPLKWVTGRSATLSLARGLRLTWCCTRAAAHPRREADAQFRHLLRCRPRPHPNGWSTSAPPACMGTRAVRVLTRPVPSPGHGARGSAWMPSSSSGSLVGARGASLDPAGTWHLCGGPPGGDPRERVRAGKPVLVAADDVYTNHIHADDLARACLRHLCRLGPARLACMR